MIDRWDLLLLLLVEIYSQSCELHCSLTKPFTLKTAILYSWKSNMDMYSCYFSLSKHVYASLKEWEKTSKYFTTPYSHAIPANKSEKDKNYLETK